jgi:hypothetical protein
MYRIAIIGAGELGSRHLQGLFKINVPISIEVLDNNEKSLETAKKRASEITDNANILGVSYLMSVDELSSEIDLCIVATTANVRFEIMKKLISKIKIKNLILEKILFQNLNEYEEANELLRINKIRTWVNCPRRLFPVYNEIKKLIKPNEKLTYTVVGGDWGLACNSIHFVDHLSFLNSNEEFKFQSSTILNVVEAKRKGFYELVGTLIGSQSNGSEIFLHSREKNTAGLRIQILSESYFWEIDEVKGELYTSSLNHSWERKLSTFSVPYQSELTHLVCEDVLLNCKSSLPSFESSAALHQVLLKTLQEVFCTELNINKNICPIT